jgi:hypothetical protein
MNTGCLTSPAECFASRVSNFRLRKMKMEKKQAGAKRRMMCAVLDSDFLYEALFAE